MLAPFNAESVGMEYDASIYYAVGDRYFLIMRGNAIAYYNSEEEIKYDASTYYAVGDRCIEIMW